MDAHVWKIARQSKQNTAFQQRLLPLLFCREVAVKETPHMFFAKDISSSKSNMGDGNIMEKLRYIIYETFVSADAAERESRLQSLMNEYLRTLEKQIARDEIWG